LCAFCCFGGLYFGFGFSGYYCVDVVDYVWVFDGELVVVLLFVYLVYECGVVFVGKGVFELLLCA